MMKADDPLGDEPLVVCASCESIVTRDEAVSRRVTTSSGPVTIWVCENCIRLGEGEAVRKYVMKSEKRAHGR